MVNSCDMISKRPKISSDLHTLIQNLKTNAKPPIPKNAKKSYSSKNCLLLRNHYPNYKAYSLLKDPIKIAENIIKQTDSEDTTSCLSDASSEENEDNISKLTFNTSEKSELWNKYFELFYIDAYYNTVSNYTNYVESCLKLLNILPMSNLDHQKAEKLVYLPEKPANKKTLILDLDETLIHSDMDYEYSEHDVTIHIVNDEDGTDDNIPLFIRPGLSKFLYFAKENFEVICFTSSCKDYADPILDYLDPDKSIFSHRLYRESCLYIEPGIYLKDLDVIANRTLKETVIVDNSLLSFANQLDNGILVSSFYEKEEEDILKGLMGYLSSVIIPADDVREKNKECLMFSYIKKELYKSMIKEYCNNSEFDNE
jgi:Dullard-like phosphatase family protein